MLLLLLAAALSPAAWPAHPATASVLVVASDSVPPDDAQWQAVELPASSPAAAAWYAIDFTLDAVPSEPWSLYLPYLYGGGRLFLNGERLSRIGESSADMVVRWERPHLVPIPPALLRAGANRLAVRVAATPVVNVRVPLIELGPTLLLLGAYETRLFFTRTMSQFTVLACLVVGTLAGWIWWRRREETLYGLFGAVSLLWGVRTLTFVVEALPAPWWHVWRALYFAATGGFVIMMLLFAMELCAIRAGRLKWWLIGYWAIGPVGYLATGGNEMAIGRFWVAGLLPIGAAVLVLTVRAAVRRPSAAIFVLATGMGLGVLAGLHDYLLAAAPAALHWIAPGAAAGRVFLLHYAADLLLIGMGAVLAGRLVNTLHGIAQLNRTLESRVAETERRLEVNFARMLQLERQHAAARERQEIMRDLHDGLGSDLSVALTRAEAGRIDSGAIVGVLRECLADMRLTIEAMNPEHDDFLEAWSSFRFRWHRMLEGAGLSSHWQIDVHEQPLAMQPRVTVQLLRIVQEALTNVVKHARASHVTIELHARADRLLIAVGDNGNGIAPLSGPAGHGLTNMRARAARLGARLEFSDAAPGLRVVLSLPCAAADVPQTWDGKGHPVRAGSPRGCSRELGTATRS